MIRRPPRSTPSIMATGSNPGGLLCVYSVRCTSDTTPKACPKCGECREKCSKTRGSIWLSAQWRVFVLREGEVLEKAGLTLGEHGFRVGTSAMGRRFAREQREAAVPQVSTKPCVVTCKDCICISLENQSRHNMLELVS